MKSNWIVSVLGAFVLVLSGCASGTKRGSVVMKVNDEEAHVGMGEGEVSVGDHVELYRNVCTGTTGRKGDGGNRTCRKEETGHGEVTQLLNKDYSVVKFPSGTQFSEGDTLEKHAH